MSTGSNGGLRFYVALRPLFRPSATAHAAPVSKPGPRYDPTCPSGPQAIVCGPRASMQLSARNVLKGTVKSLVPGAVNAEVVIEVAPGFEIASVITNASVQRLKLKVGAPAYAVIKASDVLVGVDH